MKKIFFIFAFLSPFLGFAKGATVISHESLPSFGKAGAILTGLATSSLGAKQYEVWRSTIAPGGCTPKHTHETEEIFIFLTGKGKVIIDEIETEFEAPCTVICPANIQHQFFNIGDVPSDQIVVLGLKSTIIDQDQMVMHLPWRE